MSWARMNRPTGAMLEMAPAPLVAAMEHLTASYTGPTFADEMARARREFETIRGKVYEDEPMFEPQLGAFLEWYVLDRPLAGGEPPAVQALRGCAADEERRPALRALALSFRSLFEVVEALRRETLVHDLLGGGLWRVHQEPPLDGVDPEDIFEGRLLPWEGEVRFGPVFFFHPRAARPSILSVLGQLGERGPLGPEVLGTLAVMRLKHDRFRNIAIDRIYSLSWRGGDGDSSVPSVKDREVT